MKRNFTIVIGLVIILFSTTTLYAQTDIKNSLKSWYMNLFQEEIAKNKTEIDQKITSTEKQMNTELDEATEQITSKMDHFQRTSTTMSEEEITAYLDHYKYQLDQSKKELITNLNFESFLAEETEKIEEDVEDMAVDILRDILEQQN